jgi:hypothetical protein
MVFMFKLIVVVGRKCTAGTVYPVLHYENGEPNFHPT